MALFGRKKKKNKDALPAGGDALLAVLGAAVAASDNEAHIVAIAAALAVYKNEDSNLRVRKLDRMAGVLPAWGVMGIREQIDSRRF